MAEFGEGNNLSFHSLDMNSGSASDDLKLGISSAFVVGEFGTEGFVPLRILSFFDFIASNNRSDPFFGFEEDDNSVGAMINATSSDTETKRIKSRAAWLPVENILLLTFLKTVEADLLCRRWNDCLDILIVGGASYLLLLQMFHWCSRVASYFGWRQKSSLRNRTSRTVGITTRFLRHVPRPRKKMIKDGSIHRAERKSGRPPKLNLLLRLIF